MRTVAILGGGDWNDASVSHVSVPDDMDLDAKYKEYRAWYREWSGNSQRKFGDYQSFEEWLLKNGAEVADVEEFETS